MGGTLYGTITLACQASTISKDQCFSSTQTGRLQKENLETEYCSRDTSFPIENIQNHIGIVIDAQCGRCCPDEESMEHLFLKCIYAYVCWRGSHITNEILLDSTSSLNTNFKQCQIFIVTYIINLSHIPL